MRGLPWIFGTLLLVGLAWREWTSSRWMTDDGRVDELLRRVTAQPQAVEPSPSVEPQAGEEALCHLCVLENDPGYLSQFADDPGWPGFLQKNREGAERGDTDAQYQLGMAYLFGGGVQNNRDKAFELFAQAAAGKHPKASRWHAVNLENIHSEKTGTLYGTAESRRFHEVAVEGGVTGSMSRLAGYHESIQNYAEAARYHRLAIDAGAVCAKYSLACLLLEGKGVTKDVQRAIQLMREDTECANVAHDLADVFTQGKHIDRDYAAAVQALQKTGLPGHLSRAARLFETGGPGLERSKEKALKLYEAAKEAGGDVDDDVARLTAKKDAAK